MTNEEKFIQGLTANFVYAELRNQPAAGARRKRLNELMRGGVTTHESDGVVRRQRYTCAFEGVAPITELLDPDWSAPVAQVDIVMQAQETDAAA